MGRRIFTTNMAAITRHIGEQELKLRERGTPGTGQIPQKEFSTITPLFE